jgi:glycosyltransferase involved in cell wall biosynthesis
MKDHATLLKAAALVLPNREDVFLVCVGDGPPAYREKLQNQASSLGIADRTIWAGIQDDMAAAYNAFDVCCLSSAFGEGFPNALGEAMACGVPCVATDVGDAARILADCGVVVPPKDPSRMADGLRRLLASASLDLKRACRERIAREFSLDRMVGETERVLRMAADGS